MPQLRDRGAIAGKGHRLFVHNPVKKPALNGVVVAWPIDIGRSEAGKGNAFGCEPSLGVGLSRMAAFGVCRTVFIQRPMV